MRTQTGSPVRHARAAVAATPVRLWTLQPDAVWRRLRQRGRLRTDRRYRQGIHTCYDWLAAQLRRRLPGYRSVYPWWAYCAPPDLRRVRHEKPRGRRFWLLELEVPSAQLILFPAWAWDAIFCGEFLSTDRREAMGWRRRLLRAVPDADDRPTWPEPWETELRMSWERLFEPGLPGRSRRRRTQGHSEWEAVFEVLDLRWVRRARSFLGAGPNSGQVGLSAASGQAEGGRAMMPP